MFLTQEPEEVDDEVMEVEHEEVNSLTGGETDNGGEESQILPADIAGPSRISAAPSRVAAGPSHVSAGPSHAFETAVNTEQQRQDTGKQQETNTVNASNVAEVPTIPETTDIIETASEPVLSLETVKVTSLETIPERSCISLKEPIEEAVSEELPKDIFDNSSENESVVSGPPQTSHIEEKPEATPANPIPSPDPTSDPTPLPVPHVEQRAPPVIKPTTLSTPHVEQQPVPVPMLDVQHTTPPPPQNVEHKSLPTPTPHVEHKPPPLSSISENKYMRIAKDVEGVDKRLAEVSDCPNLSLVDKVVITDVTTAKGTITVKECTTDEGFFANNVSPEEAQTANGSSLT